MADMSADFEYYDQPHVELVDDCIVINDVDVAAEELLLFISRARANGYLKDI